MPRDLVGVIQGLRKDNSSSMYELEKAVVELAREVQTLQDEVDDLRDELRSGRRGAPSRHRQPKKS